MDDLRGRLASEPFITFDSLVTHLLPVPFEVTGHEMRFRIVNGLPNIDYFQMNIVGGTITGDLSVLKTGQTFTLEGGTVFSGLDANNLLPEGLLDVPDEDSEVSGRVSLTLPLSTDSRQMLKDLRLDVDITHIGSKALDRFLYSLDPYESNESIVKQRNLLRTGSPRWVKLNILYGDLSMSGQVSVKGIMVDLPQIDRINLTELPIQRQLDESLSNLGELIDFLKIMSASGIGFSNNGMIEAGKGQTAQGPSFIFR